MKNTAHPNDGEPIKTGHGLKDSPKSSVFVSWRRLSPMERTHLRGFLGFSGLLVLLFSQPLLSLIRHAAGTELHSHILLVPFISVYLLYVQQSGLPWKYRSSPAWAALPLLGGLTAVTVWWRLKGSASLSENDLLALMALSFILLLISGGFLFLGCEWMSAAAFPVAFLFFMIPLPDGAANWLETLSKLASADAADLFFNMTGTPALRDGTVFKLPGIVIEVAQECSGIRSSWVLLITSLIASHLFLQSPWRRIVLVALVIPLGILRNGFRIWVISWLCVHVGPHMIDSVIHRRGGPFFFALSLVPLFVLLLVLRKGDARETAALPGMGTDGFV